MEFVEVKIKMESVGWNYEVQYAHSEYPWSIELESDSLLDPSFF